MMINEHCYGFPEYPKYKHDGHPEAVQSDWAEKNFHSPHFIKNKPNFVLSINNVLADKDGNFHIDDVIGPIPNDEIYAACEPIFNDVL